MRKSCSFQQLIVTFTLAAMLFSVCAHAQDIFIPVSSLNTIVRLPAVSGSAVTFASSGLNEPEGLVFDRPGNLYVVNFGNSTVEKFAYTNGALSASGTVFASTGLNNPSAIAIDPQGNIYVANDGNNTVEKFSPAGTDLGVFASANIRDPQGLAFDDNGNLYVGNLLLNTIEKFSPTGTDLGVFASGFNSLRGLGFFEGNLYAVDFGGTGSVQIFTPDGKSNGTLTTGLNQPWSVAFDNSDVLGTTNVVYVANNGNKSIERYDNGSAFGNRSTGTPNLVYIAVEPAVHSLPPKIEIFIQNGGTNIIAKLTSSGESNFINDTNVNFVPEGLALDAGGNLYVAQLLFNSIEKYSPEGTDLGAFTTTGLNVPVALAFDTNGELYASNLSRDGNSFIEKFSSTGTDLGVFANTNLDQPGFMTFDATGNLFVSNLGNNSIEKFDSNGNGTLFTTNHINAPFGVAFDANGNLYVANAGTSSIDKYSSTGTYLAQFANASSGLFAPSGLAFASDGTLYVSDEENDTIMGFNSAGKATLYANSGLNTPEYIVVKNIVPAPIPLHIQLFGTNVVLTWTDPELLFSLQAASSVTGAYVKVSGAINPFTNSTAGSQKFFRLQAN
jgi:tripartite motif-containing protein 71